jgi:hypothetical protein
VAFTPPKGTAFKQFVILDVDGNLASLSAIDGGQVDEILTKSGEEYGGDLGGEVRLGPAKGGGKRAKTRKTEEEIRRAETRHSIAVMRYLRGAPSNALERGLLEEQLPDLIEALVPMGIEISEEDIFIPGPAFVLRSICAYR